MTGKELCAYVPGSSHLVDMMSGDFGQYSMQTIEEMQKEYPGSVVMELDEACRQIDIADALHYRVGQAEEVTGDAFAQALGCLPPCRWRRYGDLERFYVSELMKGAIASWYVRIGARFFHVYDYITANPLPMFETCASKAVQS